MNFGESPATIMADQSLIQNVALIVVTCDKYSDLWYPHCELLSKFWPDCPFRRFIITNEKLFNHPFVETLPIGPDRSWSDSLRQAVLSVPQKYVLLLQEDFLIEQVVNSDLLVETLQRWSQAGGKYLRLATSPRPKGVKKHRLGGNIVEIPPESPYRISNQASIWEKGLLLELLVPGESPWQMETAGSVRSVDKGRVFFNVEKSLLCYHPHGALVKGKWRRSAARKCRQQGIWNSARQVQTIYEEAQFTLTSLAFNLLYSIWPSLLWSRTLTRYGRKQKQSVG